MDADKQVGADEESLTDDVGLAGLKLVVAQIAGMLETATTERSLELATATVRMVEEITQRTCELMSPECLPYRRTRAVFDAAERLHDGTCDLLLATRKLVLILRGYKVVT